MRVFNLRVHVARNTRCTVYVVLAVGFTVDYYRPSPFPVATRSKAWVCNHSLAGIAGLNPAGGMDVCL